MSDLKKKTKGKLKRKTKGKLKKRNDRRRSQRITG